MTTMVVEGLGVKGAANMLHCFEGVQRVDLEQHKDGIIEMAFVPYKAKCQHGSLQIFERPSVPEEFGKKYQRRKFCTDCDQSRFR